MSVVSSVEADLELKNSALNFLLIFASKMYELPTISPDIVQSLEIVEGEWGTAGFVYVINYTLEGKAQVAKIQVQSINITDLSMTFNTLEGDLLEEYNSFKFILKLSPNILQGSFLSWTLVYEKPTDDTPDPNSLLDVLIQVSKDIDAYLGNLI